MQTGEKGVVYGLQVRRPPGAKPVAKPVPKRSVFGDGDSDDDAELNVEQQIARQAARKQSDKKVAELHAAALAEDAAIFDYDSHYGAIQEARAEPKKQEKLQRKSRYIAGLLEKAEERKAESDILYERQLAKERAAEDHLFGDKEKFVTAAYRAKLAERAVWLEEQRRKKEEEEANAVEKRGHMGDFYRNLLRSNVAFGGVAAAGDGKKAAAGDKERGEQEGRPEAAAQRQGQPAAGSGAEEEAEEPQWLPRDEQAAAAAAAQQGDGEPAGARHVAPAAPGGQQEQREQPQARQQQADAASHDGTPGALADAGVRRNKEDAVAAARERYLARKRQKTG